MKTHNFQSSEFQENTPSTDTIASTIVAFLQYMNSKQVLLVLNSAPFVSTFLNYFSEIPFRNIPILLSINLSASKKISGLATAGPVQDWILRQECVAQQAHEAQLPPTKN